MRHIGQKRALHSVRRFRRIFGGLQLPLHFQLIGYIMMDQHYLPHGAIRALTL